MLLPTSRKRRLLLSLQLGDALLDGLRFLLQTLQVLLEPGDLLILSPEAWPKAGMPLATTTTGVAVTVASMPATVMAPRFATHVLTPFHISIW